uniref:Uncharacterized protein TCIL3000_9_2320 n=1 Tax=Trypanosoma congolense (strain IL3000) TaxID=1068625 RepID=G0UTX1_TRYCI|nr:unnamed protein product [Trypanosoma congolense IL3000]
MPLAFGTAHSALLVSHFLHLFSISQQTPLPYGNAVLLLTTSRWAVNRESINAAMEPENVEDYSLQSYWVKRFESEDHYDWFSSVHREAVTALCDEIVSSYEMRRKLNALDADEGGDRPIVRALHLGTGNSSLCMDLHDELCARDLPFDLHQVAMDYAPNVIDKMRNKYPPDILPNTQWVLGDVRQLQEFHSYGPFDIVIEKGTLDALEADKNRPGMEEDIAAMIGGVSELLKHARGYGTFMQITWVPPFLRLPYTKGNAFEWGDQVRYSLIGDSDIYRLFVYTIKG